MRPWLRPVACTARVPRTEHAPKGALSRACNASDDPPVSARYGYHDVFRSGLREIVALRAALDALEAELVVGARLRAYGWNLLAAEDLRLSPAGVRKRHPALDPLYARKRARAGKMQQ